MITLCQFHRIWGLPNASPFCMKVETYLRMIKLPYDVRFISNPQQASKGKLPYIQIDGKNHPDSEFIIDELKYRFDTVKSYCDRMWDLFYSDFPKPIN